MTDGTPGLQNSSGASMRSGTWAMFARNRSSMNCKLKVILGNNDFALDSPPSLDLERGGERFHLIHILPRRMPPESDWLLFGHTHRPADEMHRGFHLFNPGSAGRANKGAPVSVGFLTREKGGKFRANVVPL